MLRPAGFCWRLVLRFSVPPPTDDAVRLTRSAAVRTRSSPQTFSVISCRPATPSQLFPPLRFSSHRILPDNARAHTENSRQCSNSEFSCSKTAAACMYGKIFFFSKNKEMNYTPNYVGRHSCRSAEQCFAVSQLASPCSRPVQFKHHACSLFVT